MLVLLRVDKSPWVDGQPVRLTSAYDPDESIGTTQKPLLVEDG